MAVRLDEMAWAPPARLVREDARATADGSTVLQLDGRWAQLHVTLRAPAAWNGAHVVTVRARNRGTSFAVVVVDLATLDWTSIGGGRLEAKFSTPIVPCEGFSIDVTRAALEADPGLATIIGEAHGPHGGVAAIERCDQLTTPRALPQIEIALMGWDAAAGKLRPIVVDGAGALELA